MGEIKKCGNCHHFILKKETSFKGTCECNGKNMNPELLAGCLFWQPQSSRRVEPPKEKVNKKSSKKVV